MKKKPDVLKIGQPAQEPQAPEPKAPPIVVLDDAAIDAAPLKELRAAYRDLRTLHEKRLEELIGERVKEALDRVRKENKKTGGHVPLGFDANEKRELKPNKRERQIMRLAKQQREAGNSFRKIAVYLEERGFVARNEKRFEAAQVKRLVERADTFLKGTE